MLSSKRIRGEANSHLVAYFRIEYQIVATKRMWLQSGSIKNYCMFGIMKNAVLWDWHTKSVSQELLYRKVSDLRNMYRINSRIERRFFFTFPIRSRGAFITVWNYRQKKKIEAKKKKNEGRIARRTALKNQICWSSFLWETNVAFIMRGKWNQVRAASVRDWINYARTFITRVTGETTFLAFSQFIHYGTF